MGKYFLGYSIRCDFPFRVYMQKKLLLVDDDSYLSGVLKRSLEKEGFVVELAASGEEAMKVLTETRINLILMDIELGSGMDGIESARKILSKEIIPVIFLSSHTERRYVDKAGEVSSYGYVVKDSGIPVLIASIRMAFRLHEAYCELKVKEEEVREKERILAESQKIARLGSFTLNMRTGIWKSSVVLNEIFGIDQDFQRTIDGWLAIIPEDSRQGVHGDFYNCVKNKSRFDREYRIIRPKDGKERCVHSLGAFDQADGNMMIGTVLDITERKRAEKAISESETKYRTLLNASPEGIIVMDLKGKITDVSTIALELFEKKNFSELTGKTLYDLVDGEEVKRLKDILKTTLAEGLIQNVEIMLNRNVASKFPAEISTTLIQESDGKPRAFMAIIRDISERKKMEQQMIHSERMISLGEMAAGIAHEINQPLNNISLSLENILFNLNTGEEINKKYLQSKSKNIFDGITRIENIIDYIRAYSRRQDDFISAPFDLNASIRFAVMLVSEQLGNKGIELEMDLYPEPIIIAGNTFKFEQVILNLMVNAKDAIEERAKTAKPSFGKYIRVRSWQKDQYFLTQISDSGVGIKPEDMDKIMLPFYTTKELGKGTGLGLPLSYKIINEMKGEIHIESKVMEGTTIKIKIPINC